jgi:hypothetical protein
MLAGDVKARTATWKGFNVSYIDSKSRISIFSDTSVEVGPLARGSQSNERVVLLRDGRDYKRDIIRQKLINGQYCQAARG